AFEDEFRCASRRLRMPPWHATCYSRGTGFDVPNRSVANALARRTVGNAPKSAESSVERTAPHGQGRREPPLRSEAVKVSSGRARSTAIPKRAPKRKPVEPIGVLERRPHHCASLAGSPSSLSTGALARPRDGSALTRAPATTFP